MVHFSHTSMADVATSVVSTIEIVPPPQNDHKTPRPHQQVWVPLREWVNRDARMMEELNDRAFAWFCPMILASIALLAATVGLLLSYRTQTTGQSLLPFIVASGTGATMWILSVVYVRVYMSGTNRILREYTNVPMEFFKSANSLDPDISRSSNNQ